MIAFCAERIGDRARQKSQVKAREYYADLDLLYLKVQAEGYVAFSSGLNNSMFGDQFAVVPITGIDTTFSVSAFYSDSLPEKAYQACREGFESCRDAMKDWNASQGSSPIGFSLASFDKLPDSLI